MKYAEKWYTVSITELIYHWNIKWEKECLLLWLLWDEGDELENQGKTFNKTSEKHTVWLKIQKQPPEVLRKKGVFKNFAKFTGKQLRQSLFFNKVTVLRTAILLKKRLWRWCFPVNFSKFLKAPFLKNTSGRLLLKIKTL